MKRLLLLLTLAIAGTITLFAQTKIIGTVLDKDKQPLMGAFVMPQGANAAVTTDFDGRFEVNVPIGTEIKFSYYGINDKYALADTNMVVIMDGKRGTRATPDWAKKQWNHILMAEYGLNAMNLIGQSIGLRYGMCHNAGWYIGARYVTSDFNFKNDGTLSSDGTTYNPDPSGVSGTPIMTGIYSFNQISASAGLLWRMGIPLFGYIGGGYGYRRTTYQTTADNWFYRSGDSPHIGLAEIGFIGDIHYFTISLGCEVLFTSTIEVYPKIGIGCTFPAKKTSRNNKGGDK